MWPDFPWKIWFRLLQTWLEIFQSLHQNNQFCHHKHSQGWPDNPCKYLDSIATNTDGKVPRCTFNTPGSVAENTATDGPTWPWKISGFGCCKQTWKYPAVSLNTPASVLTTRPKMSPHLQNIQRCHACKCSNTDSNCLITRPVNNSQSLTSKSLDWPQLSNKSLSCHIQYETNRNKHFT